MCTKAQLGLFLTVSVLPLLAACAPSGSDKGDKNAGLPHQPTEIPFPVGAPKHTVGYTVDFADAAHHYLHVRGVFPAPQNKPVELSLAVWTPGSYLVREYARHIEDVKATDFEGKELQVTKTRKNRWRVEGGGNGAFVVDYKVYSRELSVRTNFVDADHAIINGAPTFLRLVDGGPATHEVTLTLPEGWPEAQSALQRLAPNHFRAKSYDELVDSPIVAGRQLTSETFEVANVSHAIVQLGDSSQWDAEEVAADLTDVVKAVQHFWGVVPYESYSFLNVLLGGRGGLEHLDSTLIMASPFSTRTGERYRSWLALATHEFFHTWNIKRLRPKSLGPFDYENENYTSSLWIAEGITSYYADLLMKRAGLLDQEQYLARLSEQIRSLQTTPGRSSQPLSQASQDAWIKYYRRDENSVNSSISYYTKGAVVAFLLDAKIRQLTGSAKSLDDLMRLMYQRYSGESGFTPEDFRAVAAEVAGANLNDFFASTVDSSDELDYEPALALFGLKLSGLDTSEPSDSDDEDAPSAWLGADLRDNLITSVRRGTPAYSAGLNVDDEVLAIDGYRSRGNLDSLLDNFKAGQTVKLTIARHGRLRELPATLGKNPEEFWTLSLDPQQNQLEAQRLKLWLAEYDL